MATSAAKKRYHERRKLERRREAEYLANPAAFGPASWWPQMVAGALIYSPADMDEVWDEVYDPRARDADEDRPRAIDYPHYKLAVRMAMHVARGNKAVVEDLVQEAFLLIHRQRLIERYDPSYGGSLERYLFYRSIRWLRWNMGKVQKHLLPLAADQYGTGSESESVAVLSDAQRMEKFRRVMRSLRRHKNGAKIVGLLYYCLVNGLDLAVAAKRLRLPSPNSRKIFQRQVAGRLLQFGVDFVRRSMGPPARAEVRL